MRWWWGVASWVSCHSLDILQLCHEELSTWCLATHASAEPKIRLWHPCSTPPDTQSYAQRQATRDHWSTCLRRSCCVTTPAAVGTLRTLMFAGGSRVFVECGLDLVMYFHNVLHVLCWGVMQAHYLSFRLPCIYFGQNLVLDCEWQAIMFQQLLGCFWHLKYERWSKNTTERIWSIFLLTCPMHLVTHTYIDSTH